MALATARKWSATAGECPRCRVGLPAGRSRTAARPTSWKRSVRMLSKRRRVRRFRFVFLAAARVSAWKRPGEVEGEDAERLPGGVGRLAQAGDAVEGEATSRFGVGVLVATAAVVEVPENTGGSPACWSRWRSTRSGGRRDRRGRAGSSCACCVRPSCGRARCGGPGSRAGSKSRVS